MAEVKVAAELTLKEGEKRLVPVRNKKVLFIRHEGSLLAMQPECPHQGGPLAEGAICNGHLVCPWHMGTFSLPGGELVEPPPMERLKTYPVREAADGVFIDLEPSKEQRPEKKKGKAYREGRKLLLVGGGAASAMAAITLRGEGYRGEITVVDPVADEPVDRTRLSKDALGTPVPLVKVRIDQVGRLKLKRVTDRVVALSSTRSEARLSDGSTIRFDAALVATGGKPRRLKVPGGEEVFVLRHTKDLRKIRSAAVKGSRAVIVGTSFIGMETASALTQRGVKVTVVGESRVPFEKQFGVPIAKAILSLHKKHGVAFVLGAKVVAVSPHGVTIEERRGYREIEGDVVIQGVGVSPELGFSHDLRLAKDGSVATDRTLRAARQVWVAGDVANMDGMRIEHWRVALQQGMFAARRMLGANSKFDGVPFFWTAHYDKQISYLGHADSWDEIVYEGSVPRFKFLAFFVTNRRVIAVVSCGRDSETALLAELMRGRITVSQAMKELEGVKA
jgi:NADPH-dependent 2,4-dienoyl-CoA reductase/sulfur reductase-like enzyme/nitrite reductase/ring-hydroxylating ferredoxin subunit